MNLASRRLTHVLKGVTFATLLSLSHSVEARVTRIVIDERVSNSDNLNGGHAGDYERIRGRVFGEIDPKDPHNTIIQDIQNAPRNAQGRVEYIATFNLYRPVDPSRGNRVMMDELPNRGQMSTPTLSGIGMDPFLYDQGYTALYLGWQGDLPEHPTAETSSVTLKSQSIFAPRAVGANGALITGPYMVRTPTLGGDDASGGPSGQFLKLDQGRAGPLAYFPADFDTKNAKLTRGPSEDINGRPTGPRPVVSPSDWMWWNCKSNSAPEFATSPSELCVKLVKGNFSPTETYTLVFNAKDPLVLGIGMAAVRDAVSYFRYSKNLDNPLAGQIDYVIGQGRSQVGNLVKTFIALGFNEDESGKRVWDGANAHIAGRRTPINYRFATPGSSATLFMPGSEAVLWWSPEKDPKIGGPARSMLDRCNASNTCPKIFETFGSSEIWNQRITRNMITLDLKRDIPLPANVRRYYFPGTTHGGGNGQLPSVPSPARVKTNDNPALPPMTNACLLPRNFNPEADQMRALLVDLTDWVAKGKEPPPSAYPMRAKGQLVKDDANSFTFPKIPGVPSPYGLANPTLFYDYGPSFDYVDLSGVISRSPPRITGSMPALVPVVDHDGNETSGAPSVQFMAPLGTFLGWNVYRGGPYEGQICSYNGSFVPFAATKTERSLTKDPRPSLEERYGTRQGYLTAVRSAIDKAKASRFLLSPDADRLMHEAQEATKRPPLNALPEN